MPGETSAFYRSDITTVRVSGGDAVTLDARQRTLTFTSADTGARTLTLSCIDTADVRTLLRTATSPELGRIERSLVALRAETPSALLVWCAPLLAQALLRLLRVFHFRPASGTAPPWLANRLPASASDPLRRGAAVVQRAITNHVPGWLQEIGDPARSEALHRVHSVSARIVVGLPLKGLGYGWRAAYDESLGDARRCQLLLNVCSELALEGDAGFPTESPFGAPAEERREQRWWTSVATYAAAARWYSRSASADPNAVAVFRKASREYLGVLRDDPHRSALAAYLRESGTTIEDEAVRVLFATGVRALTEDAPASDEALRRIFVPWFLKRYNLPTAWRLMGRHGLAAALCAATAVTVLIVWSYGYFVPAPHANAWLWHTQVSLQLLLVLLLAWPGRAILPLILPRAFFGSLLAWTTLIVVTAAQMNESKLLKVMHRHLSGWHGETVTILLPLLFAAAIMCHQMSAYVSGFWIILRRAAFGTLIAFLGSAFWGLAFLPLLQTILEGDAASIGAHSVVECGLIAGGLAATVAVALGIVVQLVWQDESMAEPVADTI